MKRKLPEAAFELYAKLGHGRSYEAIAEKFGTSKSAVAKCAKREGWKKRLEELEREARTRTNEKIVEDFQAMDERHLKVLRYIQGRSIETLQNVPLATAADAARVYVVAMQQERRLRGASEEPGENRTIIIE